MPRPTSSRELGVSHFFPGQSLADVAAVAFDHVMLQHCSEHSRPPVTAFTPSSMTQCCQISHNQTRLTAFFPRLPGSADTRKVKPIWTLLKQETVSGSGISWAICKSAPRSRQIATPAPHHSSFLQAGRPSCRPTNSVKALKAKSHATTDN